MTHIRLLGPLEVVGPNGVCRLGRGKEQALVALLALHANHAVPVDAVTDALWPGELPRTVTQTCRSYVSRIRRLFSEAGCEGIEIESCAGGYRLRVPGDVIDVAGVEELVAEAEASVLRGDPEAAAAALGAARRTWRGEALGDLADQPWARTESARLAELRLAVIERHVEAELACGRHVAAAVELEALCAAHPLRERLWGHRMVALYRCGRQADALRAYQSLRRALADELGIVPSPELQELERRVLLQDDGLRWSPSDPGQGWPAGVVTFMFTDIEGSTLLWEAYADSMMSAIERHDALIAGAVGANGGRMLKSKGEGDSTVSVFARPTRAAAAALAIQQSLVEEPSLAELPLRVRIALHTGEAEPRSGDYYGRVLNRAARLRSIAAGGQIVCSRATADLVADDLAEGVELAELGRHVLRDLVRPEHVFALSIPTPVRLLKSPLRLVGSGDTAEASPPAGPGDFEMRAVAVL